MCSSDLSPSREDCRLESCLGHKHQRHFAALVLGHWDWSFLVMVYLTSLPSSLMGGSAQIPWKRPSAGHPKSTLVHFQNHSCMQMLKEMPAKWQPAQASMGLDLLLDRPIPVMGSCLLCAYGMPIQKAIQGHFAGSPAPCMGNHRRPGSGTQTVMKSYMFGDFANELNSNLLEVTSSSDTTNMFPSLQTCLKAKQRLRF